MNVRSALEELADTAPRPTPDQTLWDRGRALRRRDRLVTSAVVLALVVIIGGLASLVLGPPRTAAPADDTVPSGAIPSTIEDVPASTTGPLETDLAIGRVSVAFLSQSSDIPVVIGATDGAYHLLDLPGFDAGQYLPPAVSPDGTQLAWGDSTSSTIRLADLETGRLRVVDALAGTRSTSLRWSPDGETLFSLGSVAKSGRLRAGRIDLRTGRATPLPATLANEAGSISPDGTISAIPGGQEPSARFVSTTDLRDVERELPADLYPDGASVRPLGWASDSLVVAQAISSSGSYAKGPHLVLFTSPDQPKSSWTFRILVQGLPQGLPVSLATDLIPDLDGTTNQQLTHDFTENGWQRDISWIIGLGVAAAIAVLLGLRWLWRRRTLLR